MPVFEVQDLRDLYDEIKSLDDQLDEASGNEAVAKRKTAERLVDSSKESWTEIVNNLVSEIQKFEDPQVVAGVYYAVRWQLADSLNKNKEIDKTISALMPVRDENAPKISDEEIKSMNTKRGKLVDKFRTMREMLEMFDEDVSDVPVPSKRTGSRGKRGPRVLVGFQWSVDGKDRSENTNNLSSIANTVAGPEINNTQDLREWLSAQGLDLENPPETFSYTLPNGKVISARKDETLTAQAAAEAEDEEDEEDEDENGNGEDE